MPCVQPAACWIMIKGITQTACRSSACHSLVKATHSADGHGGSKPQAALCARVSIICIHVVEQTHHCSLDRQQQQTLSDLPHLGSDTHESSSTCVIAIVTVHTECDRLHAMRLFPPTTCKYAAVCACSPDIHWQMALQLSHCLHGLQLYSPSAIMPRTPGHIPCSAYLAIGTYNECFLLLLKFLNVQAVTITPVYINFCCCNDCRYSCRVHMPCLQS